ALAVCVFATLVGFDRDRAFYPTLTIVIATYYGLFAVVGGSIPALMAESVVIVAFIVIATLGFKFNLWLLVGGLFGHGLFDYVHRHFISNPGVPEWWPAFCLTFDVTAAVYLAWLLGQSRMPAKKMQPPV
ncbi:MAG: hypothetical protein LJE97_09395, partial [Betaproteobacteria bacterium]|nr:hypothetical protein [Betaproteobacteria bacterium]